MITFTRLRELAGIKVLCEMSVSQAKQVFSFYGMDPADDPDTLKAQFRKLAQQHHPDRGGDLDAMKEINNAYEILKSAEHSGADNDPEEIRRYNGGAFEDFRDAEYWKRRLAQVGGSAIHPCTIYAFDGEAFIDKINVEAAWDEKSREMIYEGMLTQAGRATLVGAVWKHDPKKFVVLYANRRPQYVAFEIKGWLNDPTKDANLIQRLKAEYKK